MTRAELEQLFDEFFAEWNGKSAEAEDPSALDQCMDLAFLWCDKMGVPRDTIRHGYAYQIWAAPNPSTPEYFDLIPNTPDNISRKGDIIVLGITNGVPVGHVCIDTGKSDATNLISFDENWDTLHYYHIDDDGNQVPYSRTVIHTNYWDVVGFLRLKTQAPVVETPPAPIVEQPAPVVEVTPTEVPIPVTTTESTTIIPVVIPITPIETVPSEPQTPIIPPVEAKPIAQHGPVKTPMRLSDLIVWTLKNTISVLSKLWNRRSH
jgi:hypothetical protein